MIAIESVNGSVREHVLAPWLGRAVAGPASFVVACAVVLGVATAFAPWLGAATTRAQLQVGALWAALTVAFEAVVALARGLPPDSFLAAHDPSRGGPLAFGLLLLLFAPALGARLHARRDPREAP